VKYVDQPTVSVETQIEADAAAVWRFVSDIELPARFSTEFEGATWLEPADRAVVGATFRGHSRHPAIGEWQTTSIIVECDAERRFAWQVQGPDGPAATWRFEIEPTSTGCLLRQWAQMGPGRSGLTPAIEAQPDKEERIIERRLDEWRTNMRATVDGIKHLAEQSH
jgi:hypothetical protein